MDLLIVEPIEPEVLQWLEARHRVRHAPELGREPRGLRQQLFNVRAVVLPASVRVDEEMLSFAPMLRAVGRFAPGLENIDLDACVRSGVEVVRGASATAPAEAEFMLGALIAVLRPGADGTRAAPGRERASATIGLIGMAPAARFVSAMLSGFGSRLVGYDPTLHASDPLWGRWRIEAMGVRELLQTADAVCVQLPYFSRYQGLLGERYLPLCKPGQVLVSTSHSALFDLDVLAAALRSGRISGAWLDSVEPGLLEPDRPLHGIATLHTSPRLAGYTQESRVRGVWAVAHRLDEVLAQTAARRARLPCLGLDAAERPGVDAGLEIWENDTLRTGPDASIGLVFNDNTLLSLGPKSVFVIDEFVFAPREGKFSIVFRMLKGTAAYLSGLISKLAPESAHFKTPTASIGIRGTKFIVKVDGK